MIMARLTVFLLPFTIFVSVVNAFYCDGMRRRYASAVRYVSQHGEPRNISVYWDSDPARAAAALLTVILRHALGYQYVYLQETPYKHPTICYGKGLFQEFNLILSMKPGYEDTSKLFVHIAKSLRVKELCAGADMNQENFFNDISRLTNCGFEISPASGGHIMYVYHLESSKETVSKKIALWLKASSLQFQFKKINRTNIFRMLRTGNQSLLFVDYNIWDGDEDVSKVEQDVYSHGIYSRKQKENDVIITTNMAVDCGEDEYAPQLFEIAKTFSPSFKSLKPALEIESNGQSIEEANCEWISKQNYTIIDKVMETYKANEKYYKIITISCEGYDHELNLITTLGDFISKHYFKIDLDNYSDNCTNPYYAKDLIEAISTEVTPSDIGIVIGGVKNIKEYDVAEVLDNSPLPVFLYDAIDIDVDLTTSVWLTNGRLIHLVLALQHFIGNIDMTQVTVLSEQTPTAECFNDNLREVYGFRLFGFDVPTNLTLRKAKNILQKIKNKNTNIIIVNTNYDNAVTILSAAVELDINTDKEFIWILREWKQPNITLNLTYITFSFWSRNENYLSITDNWFDIKHIIETKWHPHTMAFVDAVLTLVKGFEDVLLKYPQARDDTQSKPVTQQFERSLLEISPVQVVYQNLTYKGHSPEEAVVFVDKWERGQHKTLARYRVNATARSVHLERITESRSNLMGSGNNVYLHSSSVLLIIHCYFLLYLRLADIT